LHLVSILFPHIGEFYTELHTMYEEGEGKMADECSARGEEDNTRFHSGKQTAYKT